MDRYNNYHKHTHVSNIFTPDVNVKIEDYAKRAVELGEKNIFSTEHGSGGDIFEAREVCDKYGLGCKFGMEGYIVPEPPEKDNRNYHIILIPKTNVARKKLNKASSHANRDGYYYKPRLFLSDLTGNFDSDELFITSACMAGLVRDEDVVNQILIPLVEKFGKNVFLEVQNHNEEHQIAINEKAISFAKEHGLDIIAANDSHYIYPEQAKERLEFLKGKGINYGEEDTFILDYPSIDVMYSRFEKQGVLTKPQIIAAINNTLVFDSCENIDINKKIKMPSIYKDKTEEEKIVILKDIVNKKFNKVMEEDGSTSEERKKYAEECRKEMQVIEETSEIHTSDYFLLNDKLFDLAINKYGGILTRTGRGSCGAFILNKILGLTQIDRLRTTLPMYGERFMSTARLLENHALPDFDANVVEQEPFVKASKELLGEDGCFPMLAYGTMGESEAFRNVCRSAGEPYDEVNEVSKDIGAYRDDKKWGYYIEESQKYVGTIVSASVHPCAHLLMDCDIEEEVGVVKLGDFLCAMITSSEADSWKYLKNDYLIVSVWDIISKVFKSIGQPIMPVKKLLENIDEDTWKLFDDGITCTLNQVGEDWATALLRKYKPRSMEELAMFVASIRPNFAPQRDDFIARKPHTTGSKELDKVLESTGHRVLFQENLMSYFDWLGVTPADSIGIIKKISKKKIKPEDFKELEGNLRKRWVENVGTDEGFDKTWSDMQAQMAYGFNCIAGNTILKRESNGGYTPTVDEMYNIMNSREYAMKTGHKNLHSKYKTYGYGNAFSMFDDGKIRPNRIVDIHPAGIRPTFKVTTKTGCSIVCTDKHNFPTPNGKKPLSELKVGDVLYCMGTYEKKPFDTTLTDGDFENNHPKSGQQGFQRRENGCSVLYDRFREEHVKNQCRCENCGKIYDGELRFEVHHKDFNRKNNNTENYQWLCCNCHKSIHYKHGRTVKYQNGINSYLDEIVSIEPDVLQQVYDIEMADPAHNFISESGLVTANSPHGAATALDCLYGAYLKKNYPLHYYTVVFNIYGDDKEKTSKLTKELKYFGINIKAGKFRSSRAEYSFDESTRTIYKGIGSIKYISAECADQLYSIRFMDFPTFTDLLVYLRENTTVDARQIKVLTTIGFFSEFGKNKKLLAVVDKFFDRYKKTYVAKTKEARIAELKSFEESLPDEYLPLVQRIASDRELLGYVSFTQPELPKNFCFILAIDAKFTPRATLYCIATGKSIECKVDKKFYGKHKFKADDILYCKKFQKRPNWKKTENGFEQTGTYCDCLVDYDVVTSKFA